MKFLNPEEILENLPLKKDMIAVDFGCGSGGWAIPLSKRLEKGVVYAIDLLKEPLSALKGKMEMEKISNIKILREDIEKGVSIQDSKADLVLLTNFLFQVEEKEEVIKEAVRVLNKGGMMVIIDFHPDSFLSPGGEKISPERVKEISQNNNLSLKDEFQVGLHHFGLIFKKEI